MLKLLFILPCALLWSCSSPTPLTNASTIRQLAPAATPPVTLRPIKVATAGTVGEVERARNAVAKAEEQARDAEELTKRHVTTIAELRALLGDTDVVVTAALTKLEKEVSDYKMLDASRKATIQTLNQHLTKARSKLRDIEATHVPAAELASVRSELEKSQHRIVGKVSADALEECEKQLASSERAAAKYKAHYDTRWWTYIKLAAAVAVLTFTLTILLVIYLKSKSLFF